MDAELVFLVTLKEMHDKYANSAIFRYVETEFVGPTGILNAIEDLSKSELPERTKELVMLHLLDNLDKSLQETYSNVHSAYVGMLKSVSTKKAYSDILNILSDARDECGCLSNELREKLEFGCENTLSH